MAHQNKELGRFQLTGIRRAPRGVPQIEVTFSIDANGIVNVSAKDLGTGKAQEITITATSNMSQAEIDRAVRDAQQYAAEDARLRAEATARDRCEQLLYRASGVGKSVSREDRARVSEAEKAVRRAVKAKSTDDMLRCADALERILDELGVTAGSGSYRPAGGYENPNDAVESDVMDAEYESVDDPK